jgi:hypothetical protein
MPTGVLAKALIAPPIASPCNSNPEGMSRIFPSSKKEETSFAMSFPLLSALYRREDGRRVSAPIRVASL